MYLIANFLPKKRNSAMNNVDIGQLKENVFGKSKEWTLWPAIYFSQMNFVRLI